MNFGVISSPVRKQAIRKVEPIWRSVDVVQKKKQLASIEDLQEKHRYNKFGKRVLEQTDLGQYINMEA